MDEQREATPVASETPAEFYLSGMARIRAAYESNGGDGLAAVRERTELVDELLRRLWVKHVHANLEGPEGLAMLALGGYGRKQLFPCSDIDLLFLYDGEAPDQQLRDHIREFCQELWDCKLKVSPSTRPLTECERMHSDNVEFTISLLDARPLAGDGAIFALLHDDVLPLLAARESAQLIKNLCEVNDARRSKYGNTIFHLEPNLKDGPGGLRDHNVALWLSLIRGFGKMRKWSDPLLAFPPLLREECAEALRFLYSVRCHLHYRSNRDDNTLSWDAQEECAVAGVGLRGEAAANAAAWMRDYFRHCRSIAKLASQALEDAPGSRSSLYRSFQSWRSRVSNADFSVVNGRVYLQQPTAIADPEMMLRAFEFVAQHGMPLSASAEQRVGQALRSIGHAAPGVDWWRSLKGILVRPHAALALRSMHSLGVLAHILPEFADIDCLVLRDLYHRYTVDEHSILAVESLQRLARDPQSDAEKHLSELLRELSHPARLYMATLMHDLGKAIESDDHTKTSAEIAMRRLLALELKDHEVDDIVFLIQAHLLMSATLRRDIFDPVSVEAFARQVATPERLKMLCLLTYADIKAVSPEALTPWKTENLWQLYMGASRALSRLLDRDRLHTNDDDEQLANIRMLAPRLGRRLKDFLDGLPQRYLKVHSAGEILTHIEMASQLGAHPVQCKLNRNGDVFEIAVVTTDRPMLFANIAGVLAAWGMNIVRADVFTNNNQVAVDVFQFTDRFRTLELNLQEWDRFQKSVSDVLTGQQSLEKLAAGRRRADKNAPHIEIETAVSYDDESSTQCTLIEVVTQDRPGLLYRIGAQLAELECNIELALIDTEGQMAIDVFYMTCAGGKLKDETKEKLSAALKAELASNEK